MPGHRNDGLGGPMPRGRTLFWTITGGVVAAVAVVIALIQVNSWHAAKSSLCARGASPPCYISASASSPSWQVCPSGNSDGLPARPRSHIISDLHTFQESRRADLPGPGQDIRNQFIPRASRSIVTMVTYLLFLRYTGWSMTLAGSKPLLDSRPKWPSHYVAGVSLVGDGRTLRTFSVSVLKPKTVDVNVRGRP